ncbi:MAG: hypothetical protein IPJ88_01900 [Myxococcales bacterium]|nr:MAG: hypothetical protein IPJ88_01900 [Myxococcales bacterium]
MVKRRVWALCLTLWLIVSCTNDINRLTNDESPETVLVEVPEPLVHGSSVIFVFTGSDDFSVNGFECQLDSASFSSCSSPHSILNLEPGGHTFAVRAVDSSGQIDPTPATAAWTVLASTPNNAAPETLLTLTPEVNSSDADAVFEFSGTDDTGISHFECSFDGAAFELCESPLVLFDLADAEHIFAVRAVDTPQGLADSTPASFTWSIETLPEIEVRYQPSTITPLTTATIILDSPSADFSHFMCAFDSSDYEPCTATTTRELLSLGEHRFEAYAVDTAGNEGDPPALVVWNVVTPTAWSVSSITAGFDHACAIATDGTLWCWGSNGFGQLGIGSATSQSVPTQVGTQNDWIAISAGRQHTCGIRSPDSLWCWGYNLYGQLGVGDTTSYDTPQLVAGNWQAVSLGHWHSCAINTSDTAFCWGFNENGRLGNNNIVGSNLPDSHVPSAVYGGTGISSISAGAGHSCAVKTDAEVICWGSNSDGQLGDGSIGERCEGREMSVLDWECAPAPIAESGPWNQIHAGGRHSCGIKNDGSAWCFGAAEHGQMGTAQTTTQAFPGLVDTATDYSTIAAAGDHVCALQNANLVCWGSNSHGQLGLQGISTSTMPSSTGTETAWIAISAAEHSSCGIRADQSAWCWGSTSYVQSSVPSFVQGP